MDFSIKRIGSYHEEEIRAGRTYCHICGYIDDIEMPTKIIFEWHGDSFDIKSSNERELK